MNRLHTLNEYFTRQFTSHHSLLYSSDMNENCAYHLVDDNNREPTIHVAHSFNIDAYYHYHHRAFHLTVS
jgi:hypothetical protein